MSDIDWGDSDMALGAAKDYYRLARERHYLEQTAETLALLGILRLLICQEANRVQSERVAHDSYGTAHSDSC